MERILPWTSPVSPTESATPVMACEWAWDFDALEYRFKNGKMFKVYGDEAIRIWLWKLFKTERYKELVYSWTYGNEYLSLIGEGYSQGFVKSEAERFARQAVLTNLKPYVLGLKNLQVRFKAGRLSVFFYADTIYNKEVAMGFDL